MSFFSLNLILTFISTGLTIYIKDNLNKEVFFNWRFDMRSVNDDSFQILKVKLDQLSIMGVYRSPSFASQGI